MQPDCRRHLPDDFAAFPPDGGCIQPCGGKCCTVHDSWAVGFAATNIKKILKLKLPSAPRSFMAPKGLFYFIFHF
jgi:hypothetical protein